MDKKSKTFIDDLIGNFPIDRKAHEGLKEDNRRLRILIGELKKKYNIPTEDIEKLSKSSKTKAKAKK